MPSSADAGAPRAVSGGGSSFKIALIVSTAEAR